jgi:DNA-binding CsgD family transcriptional regulator
MMRIDATFSRRYAGAANTRDARNEVNENETPTVSSLERLVLAIALLVTCALIGLDLLNDTGEGVAPWHVIVEASAGLTALAALFVLLRGAFALRRRLDLEIANFSAFREEAEHWRAQARRHVEGLSHDIDRQLTKWQLTAAEKEVAFLLLKGFELKEIARARTTSAKTARAQSVAIYAKAGLTGRSELAAFFLEDLLVPQAPGK